MYKKCNAILMSTAALPKRKRARAKSTPRPIEGAENLTRKGRRVENAKLSPDSTQDKKKLLADVAFEQIEGYDLEIHDIESSKDKIEQPALAKDERMIIPPLNSCVVISGKSGSGKTVLLNNLMTDERFYGKCEERPNGWFDKIFIFSPTAGADDVQMKLGIPKNHVYTDFTEAPELLEVIQKAQMGKLEGGGKAHTVEKICVIFDDIIGETSFMATPEFKRMFYLVRHINGTTIICTQHFTKVPKICRIQAGFVFFFAGGANEVEVIVDEFAPPQYTKKEFRAIINEATKGSFNFLTICMKVPWKYRFRRNLSEFIHLGRLEDEDEVKSTKKAPVRPKDNQITFSAAEETSRKNRKTLIEYYSARNAGKQNEQTRCFGEWVCKGPRKRAFG